MTSSEKIGRNAWFWFREYQQNLSRSEFYRDRGMQDRADEFKRVACEYLDWHFDLVEKIAALQNTTEEA